MKYLLMVYAAVMVLWASPEPQSWFAHPLSSRTRECLEAYESQAPLPNGRIYGQSVRQYRLEGKTPAQVEHDMKRLGCVPQQDWVRDPLQHKPKIYQGQKLPLIAYLCDDGGVVRIKPLGDPTQKHRPGPHGSKGLRFPYNAAFRNFADEVVKVDHEGRAVPKSVLELAPWVSSEAWGRAAHALLSSSP
jgi:hypothetical protein